MLREGDVLRKSHRQREAVGNLKAIKWCIVRSKDDDDPHGKQQKDKDVHCQCSLLLRPQLLAFVDVGWRTDVTLEFGILIN